MKIRPLSDRVVLKPIEKEKVTSSGIYIPDSSTRERPFIYEVVAVWPGKDAPITSVKVWDRVLSGQYSGDDVEIEGEKYKIVGIEYILWVIEE